MSNYLNIAQIIIAIVLTLCILLQVKGSFTGVFSTEASVYRTRRGVEKTLFQLTIALVVVFVILSIINVKVGA